MTPLATRAYSASTGVTLAATKSGTAAEGGDEVSYEFSLSDAAASYTCVYDITLAGLSSVSVANGTAGDAPVGWEIVKVSDTKVSVYVNETTGLAGKITVKGNATADVSATAGAGVQTYKMNSYNNTPADEANETVTVEPDVEFAKVGDEVTYTVSISADASASAGNDTFTLNLTGLTGATSLTAEGAETNCSASGLVITVTADTTTTSGTYTVSGTATAAAVTPSVSYTQN